MENFKIKVAHVSCIVTLIALICNCVLGQDNAGEAPETTITVEQINEAGTEALSSLQRVSELESELLRRGLVTRRGSASSFHQALFRGNPQQVAESQRNGILDVETAVSLANRLQLTGVLTRRINRISLNNTIVSGTCPKPPTCRSTRYRSIDGSCNNLDNLSWGRSFTALVRLLPPEYDDGLNLPRRKSIDNGALPSPREISARMVPDVNAPSARYTVHFAQWGQFLDHDITNTALTQATDGVGITCCNAEVLQNRTLLHPACFSIPIAEDDPFYSQFGSRCMEFVRSAAAPTDDCTLGPRQQLNQLTSFLDGSTLYGSTDDEVRNLKSNSGGKLRSSPTAGENVLPPDTTEGACAAGEGQPPCFVSGDVRVNEQTLLTMYHQIWFREHQRIAGILARLNPGWNDENLFVETRRIIGAMIQHVTYNEFLPILLGQRTMAAYQLNVQRSGFNPDYDKTVNPSISNVFATAAYRLGHTLIQSFLQMFSPSNEVTQSLPLSTQFFNPVTIYDENNFDMLLRGMSVDPGQGFDNFVSDQLTNHLFEPPGIGFGLDLVAINIQRGRDHGLPPYNAWRRLCGLPEVENFDDLASYMSRNATNGFRQVYRYVDDIDLFIAGISETPTYRDSVLPPVFGCLVAEQFRRLKFGDRFYYEFGDMESSFSQDQLNEIRKVTLARVLCDNSNIQTIQRNAFLARSRTNPVQSCIQGRIPRMSLDPWKNGLLWGGGA